MTKCFIDSVPMPIVVKEYRQFDGGVVHIVAESGDKFITHISRIVLIIEGEKKNEKM